ncbi:MAG: hypothetical protein R8M11_09230 [Gallionella sp.]
MQSRFSLDEKGKIAYRYAVTNDKDNEQNVVLIIFDEVGQIIGSHDDRDFKIEHGMDTAKTEAILKKNSAALFTPPDWEGSITFGMYNEDSIRIGWNPYRDETTGISIDGIKPGVSLAGFGFDSHALPGIGSVQMEGGGSSIPNLLQYDPDSDISILDQLLQIEVNDHANDIAAVPTINLQTPFDPIETLERLQDHIKQWTTSRLLDRAFHSKLRRSIQKAIKAYRNKDSQVAREHLEKTRILVKKEQSDSDKSDPENEMNEIRYITRGLIIDKLAARILDFDLKYVIAHTRIKD